MFTELEKTILGATDQKYKYIARDRYGHLDLSTNEHFADGEIANLYMFNSLFKGVKSGGNPIRFRKQILDDTEMEYLKAVFKPFAKRINYVMKESAGTDSYIWATTIDGSNLDLPTFNGEKMYKGMEIGKHYSLEELGITYDN